MFRSVRKGTTLVEVLACLAFLSLAVYPMLKCITQSQTVGQNAQDRFLVMGVLQDQLEGCRATAYSSALTTGTTSSNVNVSGLYTTVALTKTITLMNGYTDLYQVTVTGTWGNTVLPNRNGTITITAYMRAPHV